MFYCCKRNYKKYIAAREKIFKFDYYIDGGSDGCGGPIVALDACVDSAA